MAEVEEAIVARLNDTAALTALVDARIYPIQRPERGALPCVTYQRTDEAVVEAFGGPTGLAHPSVEFFCWASTYGGAKAVARALRDALEGWSDLAADPPIEDCRLVDSDEDYDGDDVYFVAHEFEVWYQES